MVAIFASQDLQERSAAYETILVYKLAFTGLKFGRALAASLCT